METTHTVHAADAREIDLATDSVDLVVTSPPYPMVEMWDDLFTELDPQVGEFLAANRGDAAFDAMHTVLADVWDELERVLRPGGIACINVGDATRSLDGRFRVYNNHARVIDAFEQRGFDPLPDVLWHKPTNSAAKFMGSGMIPPNAYVTLEHEYVLVFRNGSRRSFDAGASERYEAAYFWEERNRWFTDIWTDIRGRLQDLPADELRDRAAAYPFEIPYRLINMYSVYGDTVLDPFWGTGTTTLAAMVAGRDSVGYEREPEFVDRFERTVDEVPEMAQTVVTRRLDAHRAFVAERHDAGETFDYDSHRYGFPVMTSQEQDLTLYVASAVTDEDDRYRVTYDEHPTPDEEATGDRE